MNTIVRTLIPVQPRDQAVTQSRLQSLDFLRALAIMLVLFRHSFGCGNGPNAVLQLHHLLWQGGWIGVDLFFVLSGFLISSLLFREYQKHRSISFKQFFIRRGLKIYPSYWVLLLAGGPFFAWFGRQFLARTWVANLLFIQNYISTPIWGPTWSLAVEEHFYLLLPLVLLAMLKVRTARPFRWLPAVVLVVAAGCLMLRVLLAEHATFTIERFHFPTHLRIDSLMFGVLISYWYHFHQQSFIQYQMRYRSVLALAGIALLLPAFFVDISTRWLYTIGFTMLYVGSGMLMIAALSLRSSFNLASRCIAAIGAYSYSIYLWHPAVNLLAHRSIMGDQFNAPFHTWLVYMCSYLGGSLVFGMTMAKLIEFPVVRLRDRLFPSRSG